MELRMLRVFLCWSGRRFFLTSGGASPTGTAMDIYGPSVSLLKWTEIFFTSGGASPTGTAMDIYGPFHYSVMFHSSLAVVCGARDESWLATSSSSRAPREKLLTNMAEAHKRRRVDNLNEVDHLLEHSFETLSLEEKLEVKRLGPHHPRDIGISQTALAKRVTSRTLVRH